LCSLCGTYLEVEIETIEPVKQASMDSGEYSGSPESNSIYSNPTMDTNGASTSQGLTFTNSFARKRNHINGENRRYVDRLDC